ncbi:hypothetical protein LVD17_20460 [Fulvivirga ulvae]|uniref:hypothetical protein n=1 Tax=Fulvivirga ulvae TaxID=2904245 RepID=UPI001F2B0C48|nr:hypothetical protein [Fulvivirga ulvae]UII30669.1 hypothetical protein LVD17_20460 [Fulvivirga ulvae]
MEIIFTNGSVLKTKHNRKLFFKILYELKDCNGFPYIIRVSNGRVRGKSLNNKIFHAIRQNEPVELLLSDIQRFSERTEQAEMWVIDQRMKPGALTLS